MLSFLVLTVSASHAFADNRILTCSNKLGSVVFDICGIKGCPATVKLGTKATKYNLKRIKNSDGSLSYSARVGTRPTCNIEISALKFGVRTAKSVSCASKLNKSVCTFSGQGSSSSTASTSSSSSSSSPAS